MREHEIRAALHRRLQAHFSNEPETLILDELGIEEGSFRVDVAAVNGALHGYEIKSSFDTLARLPAQADAYARVFDWMTVVVAERHLLAARDAVPRWWGVVVCGAPAADPFVVRRAGRLNRDVDPFAVAQLLWRDEALALLESRGLSGGLRSRPRRELWRALADRVPLVELQTLVRDALRARRTWRADSSRTPGGA